MARDLFTNQASTTVAASKSAVSAGTTESWTVASSSAFPTASNSTIPPTQFYVADPAAPTELILVTNISGTTWSVTRGADGTTPVSHSAGFTIKNVVPAKWLQRLEDRLKKDEFNVLDFGAVGDDSTDCYAGIQAALNAARDAGGGTVIIPKGDYRFQTTPFKIYSGTHILAHPEARIKNYAGTDASMMWNGTPGVDPSGYDGEGNIVIQGGIWDQRGGVVGGAACFSFAHGRNLTWRDCIIRDVRGTHAIEINGCQTVRIVNCRFEGFYDPGGREYSEAVQMDLMKGSDYYGAFGAYDNTTCDDVLIDGCVFTTSDSGTTHEWGRGVGSHNGTIGKWHTNIRVTNNYFNVKHEAVRAYSWNRTVISNNISVDTSLGITLESIPWNSVDSEMTKDANGVQQSTSQDFQDFVITGNILYGSQSGETNQPLIFVTGEDTGRCLNGTIANNTITDCADDAICVQYGENVNITGNSIYSPGQYGVLIQDCIGVKASSNKIREPGHSGLGTFNSSVCHISDNHIENATRHGVYMSFCVKNVVDSNYIYGAGRGTNNTYAALYNDSGDSTGCSWIRNTVRHVGSGNRYNHGIHLNGGPDHLVRDNDIEAGATSRYNFTGDTTLRGLIPYTIGPITQPNLTAAGLKYGEIVAATSGIIVSMKGHLGAVSGSPTFRPAINGTATGSTSSAYNATSTAAPVTTAQSVTFAEGDRIGVQQVATASTASGLTVTYWVVENASNL
jgi:hypothetical protein